VAVEPTRAPARALALPAWAWVAGIVVISALFYYLLGRRMVAPWILTDELIYSEAAKSFASTGDLFVRDHSWVALAPIYPVLISPAWAIFTHIPDAYAAAKGINAIVMPLAAIPAYLLARRVLSQPLAIVAAALSVAVPSMLYTGVIMTENAFYPLFLGAAFALVVALERPTWPRVLLLFAISALTFFSRAQAVALIPPILTAPLLLVLVRRSGWEGLKRYWRLYGLAALVLIPPVLFQLARGRSITGLFGRYSFVSDQDYPPGSVAKWFVYHVAELDLYVGVIPFAALVLLAILLRRLPSASQAFVTATIALAFWLLLEVAAVDQTTTSFVNRVEERNMFYVAPLLLIALLVWIERGMPRPSRPAAVAAAVAAAFPIVLPLQWMLNVSLVSDTLALIPWWRLDLLIGSAGWTRAILAVCCLAAGVAFLLWPGRLRLVLPALVLVYFLGVMAFAEREWHRASRGGYEAIGHPYPDWIDRTLPAGASAAILYTGHVPPVVIWENEFFNRAAGPVYYLTDPTPGELPETAVRVDAEGVVRDDGPVSARYALSDEFAVTVGPKLGAAGPLTLRQLPGELQLRTFIEGLHQFSPWSGRHVTYTRWDCRGGSVAVTMASDPAIFLSPKTVVVRLAGSTTRVTVRPDQPVATRFRLVPAGDVCRLAFTITPAPALTMPAGTPPRPFGLQFFFP
jgi:4-amino-4-deoxy-L-arabinose transferase-like glycosyltransferase